MTFPDTARQRRLTASPAGPEPFISRASCFVRERGPETVYILMHPSSTLMPMPAALADTGMAVICAASRYPEDDRALIMEKLLIEVAPGFAMRARRSRCSRRSSPA